MKNVENYLSFESKLVFYGWPLIKLLNQVEFQYLAVVFCVKWNAEVKSDNFGGRLP
jgi:hypothetical protein